MDMDEYEDLQADRMFRRVIYGLARDIRAGKNDVDARKALLDICDNYGLDTDS
jgi:hypothetical protein